MKMRKGEEGCKYTFQQEFPKEHPCVCGGTARIAFTVKEKDEEFPICNLRENKAGEFWPHDAIAVAVYFCKECAKAVTLWNQA